MFIGADVKRDIVKLGRGELVGDIDGVLISFDERLDDDEHRLLRTEEADDDEDEREPPVDMRDGAEDEGDSRVGDTELVEEISIGFEVIFCVCCSKFFRSSETFG